MSNLIFSSLTLKPYYPVTIRLCTNLVPLLLIPPKYWKVTLRSPLDLLQARQVQLPQHFSIGEVLQPTNDLCSLPQDPLQLLHIPPVLGADQDVVLQVGAVARAEQKGTVPSLPTATPLLMLPRTGHLGCKSTQLFHIHLFVHQEP